MSGVRDAEKEKLWRDRIEEEAQSGLTIREFCRERGINEDMFYRWRRELKLRDVEKENPSGFVEVVSRGASRMGSSGVSIRVGEQVIIVLERGFDGQTLEAVLAAVGWVEG